MVIFSISKFLITEEEVVLPNKPAYFAPGKVCKTALEIVKLEILWPFPSKVPLKGFWLVPAGIIDVELAKSKSASNV